MARFTIATELGDINMNFRPDAAPESVAYYTELIKSHLFDGVTFYRSDFVIQMGTHGTSKKAPKDLHVNETHKAPKVSNTRGTAAIAHWDVPDCGNSEFFINLKSNGHLDDAYGGYCVFAEVADDASFAVVDKIAAAIASKQKPSVAVKTVRLA